MRLRFPILACALLTTSLATHASTIDYFSSFESPNYITGALSGQQHYGGSGGVIENTFAYGGTQAVSYNTALLSAQTSNGVSVSAPGNVVLVQDYVYFAATTGNPVFDPLAANSPSSFLAQIEEQNGEAFLGLASSSVGAVAVAPNSWNQFDMLLDFNTDIVYGYVDGTLIGSGAFSATAGSLSSVSFGVNTLNGPSTGTEYIDNVSVTTVTPEPSSLALLGTGILAVAGLLRKRRFA